METDLRGEGGGLKELVEAGARFDVILVEPPLKEYYDLSPSSFPNATPTPPSPSTTSPSVPEKTPYWSWSALEALPVPALAASPGFIFIWCGDGQGPALEMGRQLLGRWGYRKCEDLVWIKTNVSRSGGGKGKGREGEAKGEEGEEGGEDEPGSGAVFTPTKEHCLMGIRGTVRRSTDGHFVHCNVDTDVIIAEPDPSGTLPFSLQGILSLI